ncbi:MAG: cytochrome c oxidase subunit I, partial [Polyangia bacterium]
MSSPTTSPAVPVEPKNYLNCETGINSWLLTRDHKRIGLMFLVCVTVALFLGGVFAMLIRIEL